MIRFIRDPQPPNTQYKQGQIKDLGPALNAAFIAAGDAVDIDEPPVLYPPARELVAPGATRNDPVQAFSASEVAGLKGVVSKAGKVAGHSRPFNFTLPGQNTGTGITIANQRPALAPFYGFRVHYLNYDAATWTVTAAKAAAIPTHLGDGVAGASAASTITFNTAGTNVVPVGSGSSSNALPGILSSDVIYHPSIARTDDVTKKPLLQIRTYSVGTQNVLQPSASAAFFTAFNADAKANGRQWAAGSPSGDRVTTFDAYVPSIASNTPFVHPALVEFFYEQSIGTIAMCGDSLGAGKGTTYNGVTLDQNGMAQCIADALTAQGGKLWETASFATPSQTYSASCDTAKRIIPLLRPTHLLMHAWSPNTSPSSDAVMLDCRARLLEVADLCERNDVRLIVVTSGPVNAYGGTQDARIKAQNVWARQMAARGAWGLIDAALLLDPTNSGQLVAAYNVGDGLHYTDAFYSALASLGVSSGLFA